MNESADAKPLPAAIVLAAGKSTRMRSKLPKTLHPLCGKPVLFHVLDALAGAGIGRRIVVVGHEAESVIDCVRKTYGDSIEFVFQTEQRGTGHAVLMAKDALAGHDGPVLVAAGDTPLLRADTLRALLETQCENGGCALLTALLPDAGAYGRIVRDGETGDVAAIVEFKDATSAQREIREINAGVYVFDGESLFSILARITSDNAQGELYLTDAIALTKSSGRAVSAHVATDPGETLGINTRVELSDAAAIQKARILRNHMLAGVSVVDPATTFIDGDVEIGQDTTILPGSHLLSGTVVGEDCVIGPNAHLAKAIVGNAVQIRASFVDDSTVGDFCKIGPFAHIRPGTVLGRGVKIGNFVETKKATLADNVSAGHLTYLGDASVGENTNVGAGTITCNYDGYRKNETTIGANVFVGSNSILIAPVSIGDGALTGAGSVITKDVPPDALAVGRARQETREGWAADRRRRNAAKRSQG